ncbi:MFS transporter [Tellurirhabdus bombi]|uniref:MFS transporter n=1 Tax=Tellurirhabdus bombi TaxID=2907205 RepID=UPI001F32D33E|nr:MFS transporter [Tellurirhabdus bombi]
MTPSSPTINSSPSLWEAFRFPVFKAIWLAAFVSNIGTWMQNMAGVWLLTTLSDSQVLVALMQTATSLPVFLLSIPAGALADLLDRRKLLMTTQGFMAIVAFTLGIVTLSGLASPQLVLFFTFLLGTGAALNGPAWQSVTPEVVPRPILPTALTLNGISMNLSRAIGPAIGGLVIAYYSPGFVFMLNGVSFIATFLVIYRWQRTAVTATAPVEDFFTALIAGMRYVRYSPSLHAILVRAFSFTFGASAMWALLSLVVARKLNLESSSYGLMLTWLGAGAVTGALALNKVRERISPDLRVIIAVTIFAGVNFSLALVTSVYVLYPIMFICGTAWLLVMTSMNVSIQLQLPKWVQARVLSIYMLIFQGGMALGSLVWGSVADRFGLSVALMAAGIWLLLSLLLVIPFRLPMGDSLDLSPARNWPHPAISDPIRPGQGPVVIMIEYHVRLGDRDNFLRAMESLKRLRLRDGALRAGVFTDTNNPLRQVEFFLVSSWDEHLRQHQRFTKEDQRIQDRVLQYHSGPELPVVSHFINQPEPETDTHAVVATAGMGDLEG